MKVLLEVHQCRAKTSADCMGTFQRPVQRGRKPHACPNCKAAKAVKSSTTEIKSVEISPGIVVKRGKCHCGNEFDIKGGRGRRPTKCADCREKGTVYRPNDDGIIETIQAETIRREQAELAIQAGHERAARLVQMMEPLHALDAKRRAAFTK